MRRMLCWSAVLLLCVSCSAYAWQRDPTKPMLYGGEGDGGVAHGLLRVSSIIVSPYRRLALVNDQFVEKGDEVSGLKVIAIEPDLVQFTGPDGNVSVFLYDEVEKRQAIE